MRLSVDAMKHDRRVSLGSVSCFSIVSGTMLLLLAGSVCHPQACGNRNARELRQASLRRAGVAVLNAIAQKNVEEFLNYVGSDGIAFGIDKPQVSKEELRIQFEHKQGAYCLFFSTECITAMSHFKGLEPDEFLSKWKISYLEWLNLNRSHSLDVELEDDDGLSGCRGYFSAEAGRELESAPSSIELDFAFHKGRWLLVDTVAGAP